MTSMFNRVFLKFGFAAVLACAAFTPSLKAELIGDVVSVVYDFPNSSTLSQNFGTFTITGTEDLVNTFDDEALMFTNNQIILENTTPGQFLTNSFDGYVITLISGPSFTSVTEDAASSSRFATGSQLSSSSSQISLNIEGTCAGCVGGEKIFLDVKTATTAAPEPSSLGLACAGLAALGFGRRFLRKST